MKKTTAEWVSKAEDDFGGVLSLRRSRGRGRAHLSCFHCQQCAEACRRCANECATIAGTIGI